MIIDSIKNYLLDEKHDEFVKIINEIYKLTECLNSEYPGYYEWFFNKQVKGSLTPNRTILFVRNDAGKIVAVCCLKKDEEEKKICSLYVNSEYRNHGIGSLLFEESMKYLEITKPLATFTEDKLPMLSRIIDKYDWQLTEVVDGIYNEGVKELCYNGRLTKTHKK